MNESTRQEAINAARKELERIMAVKRFSNKGFNSVWFASDMHRQNFFRLLEKFNAIQNPEYASACYICAHEEIYPRINWDATMSNPFDWYWGEWIGKDDNDDNGYHQESEKVGQLSSAYRAVVRAGVELFTGRKHYFDLMHLIGNAGDEVYRLFIQMLEIRRDRFIIDLWQEVE